MATPEAAAVDAKACVDYLPTPHARHIGSDEFHTVCEQCRNDIANMMRSGMHGNNTVLKMKLVAS